MLIFFGGGSISLFLDADPDPHSQYGSGSRRTKSVRIWIHNTCCVMGKDSVADICGVCRWVSQTIFTKKTRKFKKIKFWTQIEGVHHFRMSKSRNSKFFSCWRSLVRKYVCPDPDPLFMLRVGFSAKFKMLVPVADPNLNFTIFYSFFSFAKV